MISALGPNRAVKDVNKHTPNHQLRLTDRNKISLQIWSGGGGGVLTRLINAGYKNFLWLNKQ